jgi:hypothetical protein
MPAAFYLQTFLWKAAAQTPVPKAITCLTQQMAQADRVDSKALCELKDALGE